MALSNLFKKKPQDPALDEGETIAQERLDGQSMAFDSHGPTDSTVMVSTIDEPEEQALPAEEAFAVPLLGTRSAAAHQRVLSILLALSLIALAAMVYWTVSQTDRGAQQVGAIGQSLMQSQRLAKSVSQALIGSPEAFPELKESSTALASNVRGLQSGSATVPALGEAYSAEVGKIVPLMERAEKNAATVLGEQKTLTEVGTALRSVSRQSSDLLEVAETISSLKLQQNAPPAEISAAGQLVMLTQRIGKSANEFLTMEGVSPEAVFLLGKDLNSFRRSVKACSTAARNCDLRPRATSRRASA